MEKIIQIIFIYLHQQTYAKCVKVRIYNNKLVGS